MMILDFLLKIVLLILGIDSIILVFSAIVLLYAKIRETMVKTYKLKRDTDEEKNN